MLLAINDKEGRVRMHHLPGLTWQQTMKMENAGSYAIEKVIIKGEQSYATSVRREREREK